MLNHDICKKCYVSEAKHIRAAYYFEQRWRNGFVECVLPTGIGPNVKSPVPKECPYILEHILKAQHPC